MRPAGSTPPNVSLKSGAPLLHAAPPNFWKAGNFSRAVKRLNDAPAQCETFAAFVRERANIEKKYVVMLRSFSARWQTRIERGPEDPEGTLRTAWMGLLMESDAVASVHTTMAEKLITTVADEVVAWKREHYPKGLLSYKTTSASNDKFKRAQRPWLSNIDQVNKGKAAYHAACRVARGLDERVRSGEHTLNGEQLRKVKEQSTHANNNKVSTRDAYQGRVRALADDIPRYRHAMVQEFQLCQDFEFQRVTFLKRTMFAYQEALAIDNHPCHGRVYGVIEKINAEADLVRYGTQHGPGMPLVVLQFTEFNTPDENGVFIEPYAGLPNGGGSSRDMAMGMSPSLGYGNNAGGGAGGGGGGGASISSNNNTSGSSPLTSLYSSPQDSLPWAAKTPAAMALQGNGGGGGAASSTTDFTPAQRQPTERIKISITGAGGGGGTVAPGGFTGGDGGRTSSTGGGRVMSMGTASTVLKAASALKAPVTRKPSVGRKATLNSGPYDDDDEEEEDWDDLPGALPSPPPEGISVRALYDYSAKEAEEISFKAGDLVMQLEDMDDQGWCTGRNAAGQIGLYPGQYVIAVST